MSEPTDPYDNARTKLRETTKWYAAALAAIGAGVAGGLSFGILAQLEGNRLVLGIGIGAIVLLVILLAIFIIQEILSPKPFHRGRLSEPALQTLLEPYEPELLPLDIGSTKDLIEKHEAATKKVPIEKDEIQRLRFVLGQVTSFASLLDLERKARTANRWVLLLFVLACGGIAFLSYLHGTASKAKDSVPIVFSPGGKWTQLAAGLAAACPGAGPYSAEGQKDKPFDGWWSVKILKPSACAGLQLSLPATVVVETR